MTSLQLWQWAILALAAFMLGVSKTGIAGLGVLGVAMAASVLPPRASVGTMLIVLLAGDVVAVTAYRRDASWHHLWRLFPWAGLGVIIGALALGRFDDTGVRRLIGAVLLLIIAVYLVRQRIAAGNGAGGANDAAPSAFVHHPWLVGATGVLAGFTTMVANASGPIMILYLLALRLPKVAFIGTAAWFFLVLNLFKAPFSLGLGLINAQSALVALPLLPFIVAGALLGRPLLHAIDQRLFEQLALLLTLVAGLRLLL